MPAIRNSAEMGKYSRADGSKSWEYLAICTCAIFGFSIGTTIGWVSPSIIKLLEPSSSPVLFTPEDVSTMVAASAVGHLFSPLVSNILVDRIGRRNTLLLSGLPVLISSAMIMMANHVWVIDAARALAGFALGMCICVTPMYIGEIASTETRGLASSMIGITISLGILFSYGICPYLSIGQVAGILMAIILVFEVSFWFMPESPYYLAMNDKYDEAELVLEKLRGRSNVDEELETIKDAMPKLLTDSPHHHRRTRTNTKSAGTLKNLFSGRANRRALAISSIFLIPQHFGGYFITLIYSQLIFIDAGIDDIPSHLATVAVGLVQLVSAILAGLLVDRLGRRGLIIGAGVIAGFANLIAGSYLFAKEYTSFNVNDYSIVFLIAILVQVFSFNCGLISTHMVLMSEIFATEIKGIGMCFVGTWSALFSIITAKLYMAVAITWGLGHSLPFLSSAIIVWATTIVLFFITPETKGQTFVQIQQKLNSSSSSIR